MTDTPVIPESALRQHVAIVAKTGAGKTYLAKALVEGLLDAGKRVCVIDPVGAWWGLRASADGKREGFPVVIFGGEHGDVPVADDKGKELAALIAERNLPCIVDLSEFSNAGRNRFVADFAYQLYRKNRQPLHLVLEEADELAPQSPMPETKRTLDAVDKIVRRGRFRGFRVVMITQRPAVLHKNVLTQCNTLIAMRLTSPQDRKAIESWIAGHGDAAVGKELLTSLASLRTGQGWVWAPDLDLLEKVRFPKIRTFDSSRTPEDDDEIQPPKRLAPVEIEGLRERFAAAVEDGGRPKKQSASAKPDKAALAAAGADGYADGYATASNEIAGEVDRLTASLRETLLALETVAHGLEDLANRGVARKAAAVPDPPAQPAAAPARTRRAPKRAADGALNAGARKLLSAVVRHAPVRLTWTQVATLAGLKARGGHFNAARKALVDGHYVVERDGLVEPGAGAPAADAASAPMAADEIQALWIARLPSPADTMLRYLCDGTTNGRWVGRADMAQDLGKQPRGGHWNNGLATLRRNHLIEEAGDRVRAAEILFGVKE